MQKNVFITGANGGIGKALCKTFVEAGYFVIASDKVAGDCVCDVFIQADIEVLSNSEYRNAIFAKVHDQVRQRMYK